MGVGVRLLVAVPAIVLLAGLAAMVAPRGLADWYYQPARSDVRNWFGKGVAPSARVWEEARAALERAVDLAPANPSLHEYLGMLHLIEPALAQSPQAAVSHLARAAELRPTAPYSWNSLIQARYRAGLTQPPFESLLVRTWRLGPSEPGVQAVVAELGLSLWDGLGPDARMAVGEAVAAGMRRNPVEMLQISQRRGRLFPACGYVQGDGRLAQSPWLKACGAGRPG